MDLLKDGWFREINELWPGEHFALQVEEVLHHEKSEFQDILVVKTKSHGVCLILDGIIQNTEHDEFSYQEMITFLPLCAHKNPERVLIIGGGDGGVAREVSKHPKVKEIVQVEIDGRVIEVSKEHIPGMAVGFESPKLTLIVGDGFEYMKNHSNEFDVIITDSGDPIGPAVNLFTETYFQLLKRALRPNGIMCSQGGTLWSQLDHVKDTINNCKKNFPVVKYAIASVPTYPTGQIGFVIGSLDENAKLEIPDFQFSEEEIDNMSIRYYNDKIHAAAFVLPNFARKILYSS